MVSVKLILLAIALLALFQADAAGRKHRQGKKRHPQGDEAATFYYLVRQWPETFCETHGCSRQPPSEKWTIHGLWPNYNKAGFPTNCPGGNPPQFEGEDIDSIRSELKDAWPSYKGPDESFWKHEYNVHGTCNINDFNEVDYFKAVLELNRDFPIDDYLKHADPPIVPSESGTYRTSEIEDVLYSHYKAKPEIMCSCPGWHQNCTTARIDSILICLDKHLQIGNCTYDCEGEGCERTNCDNVQYLPLRQHGHTEML